MRSSPGAGASPTRSSPARAAAEVDAGAGAAADDDDGAGKAVADDAGAGAVADEVAGAGDCGGRGRGGMGQRWPGLSRPWAVVNRRCGLEDEDD